MIYADELGDDAALTFTREPPAGLERATPGGSTPALIAEAGLDRGTAFICGSNGFVESASALVLEAGFETRQVRTERFGPTG